MRFDKAYVIGFKERGAERLHRFFGSAEEAGVDVELFPAVDGAAVDAEKSRELGYLSDDFELRMPGSLGCLLSHVTLWEHIHADPEVSVALICEDDALLNEDFLAELSAIPAAEIPEDWDVLRLASHKVTGTDVSPRFVRPPARYIKGANAGTYCYLIKSESALKLKAVLLPYNNRQSMDVLPKKRSDRYNLYVSKIPLAREQRFRYSMRQDMNFRSKKGGGLRRIAIAFSRLFLK